MTSYKSVLIINDSDEMKSKILDIFKVVSSSQCILLSVKLKSLNLCNLDHLVI